MVWRAIAVYMSFGFVVFAARTLDAAQMEILLVRGGSGTGGFLEGGADEQLSDIHDMSTAAGNHGWGQLAEALRGEGFALTQAVEGPASSNTPVDLVGQDLSRYAAIVFGSNNADYPAGAVDAVEDYVRGGGGALFISDANWGRDWADAPDSDQAFLDRFGLTMNQDHGTYGLSRADGDFVIGGADRGMHPILQGIEMFDGEGVSPITVGESSDAIILAPAKNNVRRNTVSSGGPLDPATPSDAALVALEFGAGRVVCHFDRNTFFNENGAGTDITRFDNRRYALQLFQWLAGKETAVPSSLSKQYIQ